MHYLTETFIAGKPMRYRRSGSGFPLLLLHGWGGSSRYWHHTLSALADRRALYAPDLPGYGDSPPLGDATPQRLAEAVIAFADALGLTQFDLNGHSFSASVAVYLAERFPERVRRLVLTCFSTYRNERERQIVDKVHNILALWIAWRRPWMADNRPLRGLVGGRFFYRLPRDQQVVRACFADFLKMDAKTAIESAASAGDPAINPAMQRVSTPTLLLAARQDAIMPPAGTPTVAQLIPNCQLHWIERCGHLPMLEQPVTYHRLLREFLA